MMKAPSLHCAICHTEYPQGSFLHCPRDGSPLHDSQGREIGRLGQNILDRYQILRFVGKGGMAQVYEAQHAASGRHVAIKILNPRLASNPDVALERFRREAQLLSRIAHPNVVAIEDFGALEDGALFMVMELLRGKTLQQSLDEREPSVAETWEIILQVCEAVQAAHDVGVVHRDIKPANVFLEPPLPSGACVVKVLDFGISKTMGEQRAMNLTKAGSVFGTPEYMSPQQARGEAVDASSDVYSIGVMLYRMLLGTVPFTGDSYLEVLIKHITESPVWPEDIASRRRLPAKAKQVVLTALAKKPSERFPSVDAFAQAISSMRNETTTSYSMVHQQVDSTRIRSVTRTSSRPPSLSATVSIEHAKGLDGEVVALAPDVFWVGRRTGGALECNAYLRVYHSEEHRFAVLIDPGPPRDLHVIGQKVAAVLGSITDVDLLFINHQDPDVAFNAVALQKINPRVHIVCSEHTWRLIHLMELEPRRYSAVEQFARATMHLVTGDEVRFIPTPYCHFRGAVMYYDVSSRVLFSGDLFGGVSKSRELLSTGEPWDGVDVFHQVYMPSGRAVQQAIARVRQLDPPPRFIAPQHGAIFGEDTIEALLDHLEQLPMGLDLDSGAEEPGRFVGALTMLIRYLIGIVGKDLVLDRVRRFEGDDTFPAILVLDEQGEITGLRIGARLAAVSVLRTLTEIVPFPHQKEWFDMIERAKRLYDIYLPSIR